MMDEIEIANQVKKVVDNVYNVGIIIFIVIMFKDIISALANSILTRLSMKLSNEPYSTKGAKVVIDGKVYKIVSITLNTIHFQNVEDDKDMIRMVLRDYWKNRIKYIF